LFTASLSQAATAGTITYTLEGTWAGYSADVSGGNPSNITTLGPTYVILTATGQTPDTLSGGVYYVPLTDASIVVSGSPSLSGDLGASSAAAFAAGIGGHGKTAGFGAFPATYLVGAYSLGIEFKGAGLSGYTGVTNLAPTHVSILLSPDAGPFPSVVPAGTPAFTLSVGSKGMLFDSFGIDTTFSATTAPEPATWAMLILGIGGVGAVQRRRREGMPAPV
jgi:hypothetical protein